MDLNYRQISSKLLADLPFRAKDVIVGSFGLESGSEETLEAIGKDLGVTRERVRQIEESGLEKIRPEIKKIQKIFDNFFVYMNIKEG
jgi:DNA-directed RNA polymerase sigma subunit (sigma70/sigma32)